MATIKPLAIETLRGLVTETYGIRCPDFSSTCPGCVAWAALDHFATQSLRSQAGVSEAVAWRRPRVPATDGNGKWHYHDGRPIASIEDAQPLYARPAPIEITEAMVERLARDIAADELNLGGDAKAVRDSVTKGVWRDYERRARRYLTAALQGETK